VAAVAGRDTFSAPASTAVSRSAAEHVYQGFATNVLNPAIATFYLVILPQFIPAGAPIVPSVLFLTAVHVSIAGSWHVVWATAGGTLARTIGSGRPRQLIEFCTGGALLLLAVRLALR
jgi:threonine/homoserine/homoserine lactone efflux protein